MPLRYRVKLMGEPQSEWRDSEAEAVRDGEGLGLASWDGERREWFVAIPAEIERQAFNPPAKSRPRPAPGSPWTAQEVAQLEAAIAAQSDIATVALRIGRSRDACAAQARRLGIRP